MFFVQNIARCDVFSLPCCVLILLSFLPLSLCIWCRISLVMIFCVPCVPAACRAWVEWRTDATNEDWGWKFTAVAEVKKVGFPNNSGMLAVSLTPTVVPSARAVCYLFSNVRSSCRTNIALRFWIPPTRVWITILILVCMPLSLQPALPFVLYLVS